MSNVFDEFQWRGLVLEYTPGLPEALEKDKITAYIGFDPTSDSLQVGNLMTLMGLARLQRYGHSPIAVAGGGTGLVGDPGGKKTERALQSREQIAANTESIKKQLARFLDFDAKTNPARLVNNADWLTTIPMMDFLRDVGKHFTVNYMLAKDSVASRLDRDEGISYTEFSYMLLQSYDFLQLFDRYGCTLQMGGSDQWGNITAGVELIRKTRGAPAYALVWPLVTDANGVKLGKTEQGAIYLDPQKTSPYRFYQFWLNTADADVIQYLKYFTWLNQEEIRTLAEAVAQRPEAREAQRTLARELTRAVHGEEALAQAEKASQALFGGDMAGLTAADIEDIFAEVPASELPVTGLEGDGKPLVDLLAETGLAKSKGEARRLIASGGVYVNNARAGDDPAQTVRLTQVVDGRFVVVRVGKKQYHLVRVLD
jgi:tyrosyl-tRNA synthetase